MKPFAVAVLFVTMTFPARAQRGAQPLEPDDHSGFEAIFDGASLKQWEGNPAFWRVDNGAILGQSTPENAVKENTFLIWRGGEPRDFELKLQFRIDSNNSGVQIRSTHLPAGARNGNRAIEDKWVLKGYQADIDFNNQWTGQLYEERGRGFLAMRGQAVYVPDGGAAKIIGNLQQTPDQLKALIKVNDWNQLHLIGTGTELCIEKMCEQVSSLLLVGCLRPWPQWARTG